MPAIANASPLHSAVNIVIIGIFQKTKMLRLQIVRPPDSRNKDFPFGRKNNYDDNNFYIDSRRVQVCNRSAELTTKPEPPRFILFLTASRGDFAIKYISQQ
ncbi:MAG: hypothetical protein A2W17_06595 [Planctomycetes bacterium RBG_16_41_13]|nr:MAG: hypothetical protein A2W17_06595 [Planctomycetes bacterium RBG_16_41_13]